MSTHSTGCRIPDRSNREVRRAILKLARRDDLSTRAESFLYDAAFDANPVEFLARTACGRHVIDVLARSERITANFIISSPQQQ